MSTSFWCDRWQGDITDRDLIRRTVTREPDHERCPGRNWADGQGPDPDGWCPCPCPCHQLAELAADILTNGQESPVLSVWGGVV